MEEVYDPESYRASEHIHFQEYFDNYRQVCYQKPTTSKNFTELELIELEMLQLCNGEKNFDLEKLQYDCNIDNLTCENEGPQVDIPQKIYNKAKISVVYPLCKEMKNLEVYKAFQRLDKNSEMHPLTYNRKRSMKIPLIATNQTLLQDIVPGSEFVLNVIVYKPFSKKSQRTGRFQMCFDYEVEVLGSNYLTQLADKMECYADKLLYKELDKVDLDIKQIPKLLYPSRFFFINDVFYNDMRAPNATDLSEVIMKWAEEKNIGPLEATQMDQTRFCDLKPRLGYPYVYVHQGECEHLVVFSDARLIQNSDCLYSKMYPRITNTSRKAAVLCYLCTINRANWICIESDRFPQEKVFLCTKCCQSYNFIDDEKVGNFKLYPYFDERLSDVKC